MSADNIVARRMVVDHCHKPNLPRAVSATCTVERHDGESSAQITLKGDIDLESAPLVRQALTRCLLDGVGAIHVDLTHVDFCDCSGLNAFLHVHHLARQVGAAVHLRHPAPAVARLLALTGTEAILLAPQRAGPT
ncbi:STAS domain-containing protein [Streptacidiphilus jiangxiensis]|uniref:Anti-sigma factor antagonist n=1 Tax=Streptacidiphilus jiangxiensis TaxID=235985 RepID=A0A1H7NSW2_STRJI|nr:STAS domain-containing protein [Streptacidiphilus jiangxiensis]SEL26414.1 anti-anti-sigma factor [Streptacidiphilus jiangxiensis]